MKMNLFKQMPLCITALILFACSSESALPPEPTITPEIKKPTVVQSPLAHTYERVIQANADNAVRACNHLSASIRDNQRDQKEKFAQLVKQWKAVETTYILGEFDSALIDQPRYIDVFHYNTNQPIQAQLDRKLNKGEPAEQALFKNAFKSINALEHVLYQHPPSDLTKTYAQTITHTVCEHLSLIQQGYQTHAADFLKSEENTTAMVLNALIDSSYKLKEWRVGDVVGLSKKYKNKPDNARAEYAPSQLSAVAIEEILHTHKQLVGENGALLGVIKQPNNKAVLKEIDQHLNAAMAIVHSWGGRGFKAGNSTEKTALYHHTYAIQKAYYEQLLGTLDIVSKILEADGD